ncbi:hypothetical protein [Vulcanisaeta souniana]|uniref:Uncharacterized protein n=2 Tax=Vulcanisaeta souniana TaxID=164452 RepID=A0A830E410_9CREN|nr:hypothetical protein [Vulcanisaeta souniana]BDR91994.1 hypothetical protein Vsou_10870 [Vulcanisaeta souniana JCM 11219]GGI68734.1 hypothetical protein GCM10007112_02180 [Vulcanisaeta souniana JCM 11219]
MIILIPVLIIAIMIGMIILGLIRPPLTVIIPLLGIYTILMLIPYIIPNLVINQYLNIRYILLPIIGFVIGYGISLIVSKYMNIEVRSIFGLKTSGQPKVLRKNSRAKPKLKAERGQQIKPEDLDKLINESIKTLRQSSKTSELLGNWAEYYDSWSDAILSISRNYMDIKNNVEIINEEASILSRIRKYEDNAMTLGFAVGEESVFKKQKKAKTKTEYVDRLIIYVKPEEIANDLIASSQILSNYIKEFDNVLERLTHNPEIPQYMYNSEILVFYANGIPKVLIVLRNRST